MSCAAPETNPAGRIDAAIIDLDGTLVDTIDDFDVALNRTLDEMGLPPIDRATIARSVGKGSEHLVASVLKVVAPQAGESDAAIESSALFARAWDGYQRHYGDVNGLHATLFPGVREGLERLRGRGWALACLTNKPTGFARALLAAKGLDGYFSVVFGGDAFERKKPDPLPLLKACAALGTVPERTLMIGDSSNDAIAARAAGCPVCLVTYGYNHGVPIRDVDADGYVDSIDAIDPDAFL